MKRKNTIIGQLLGIAIIMTILTFPNTVISASSYIADSFLTPLLQNVVESMGKN